MGSQTEVIVLHLLDCVAVFIVWAVVFALLYLYYTNRNKNRPKPEESTPKVIRPHDPHVAARHPLELGKDLPYDFKSTLPASSKDMQQISLDVDTKDSKESTETKDQKTNQQTADNQKGPLEDHTKTKDVKTDNVSEAKNDPKIKEKSDPKDNSKSESKIDSKSTPSEVKSSKEDPNAEVKTKSTKPESKSEKKDNKKSVDGSKTDNKLTASRQWKCWRVLKTWQWNGRYVKKETNF